MKKVLLLGGTGAIGNYVSEHCIALGYKVFITSRSVIPDGVGIINYIHGDATDFKFLKLLLSGVRYDAIIDFMVYRTKDFEDRVDFILSNTEHYIFLSSYRVFSNYGLEPLKENSSKLLDVTSDKKYLETDEYALAKARQENTLMLSNRKNWTIVRPSISYAAGRFQLGTLEANIILPRAYVGLPVILPNEIMPLYTTMTWAGDVARMISALLFKPQSMGTDFNVTSSESVTWENVAKLYYDVIGLNVIKVTTEDYLSLGLNHFQLKYDRLFNRICNNDKILNITGIKNNELMKLADGLSFELARTNPVMSDSFSRIHGRIDKILSINRIDQAILSKYAINYLVGYFSISNRLYTLLKSKSLIPALG